jgi:uncharacterized membrane protein YkoI
MSEASNRRRERGRHSGAVAAICAALLVAGFVAPFAPAGSASLQLAQASENVSLERAIQMVRERSNGQVLRAETRREKGKAVHKIRVLTEGGKVRTWHVDAETGRIY